MTPEQIIKDIKQLVSLPEAVIRANQLLDSPRANAAEIGEVISHDPALSAQLLKLVNSAFYNFPNKVETISRAITLIGLNELRSIIFAASSAQTFNQLAPETIDMDAFWQRSVYCGLMAKKLAELSRDDSAEALFIAGLLHDVGRLILFVQLPDLAQQLVERAKQGNKRLTDVENELLGFSTAELGAALLKSWHLPNKLWEPVRYQHHPEEAETCPNEASLLNLALKMTDCIEPELKTGKTQELKNLQPVVLNGTELTTEQLQLLATDVNLESFEVLAIVNPNAMMIY